MTYSHALGYQQITSLAAATALTVPAKCSHFIAKASGQAVRWRDDGTDPSATVGYPLEVGEELRYDADMLGRVKFIEQVAGAKLDIMYYAGSF